jgi:hypothetical protein
MNVRHRIGTTATLLLAAIGPFAAVWGCVRIVPAMWKRSSPSTDARVEKFSDYFTPNRSTMPGLPTESMLWKDGSDRPSESTSLAFVGGRLVVVGAGALVVIDPRTGAEIRRVSLQDSGRVRLAAAATATEGPEPNQVWVYSAASGQFGGFDLDRDAAPREVIALGHLLVEPRWVHGHIVTNGLFENELLHVYRRDEREIDPRPRPVSTAVTTTESTIGSARLAGSLGAPLFPGAIKNFSQQLNYTHIAVAPSRARLAMAFKWSNRLYVYDTTRMTLERAIAGPNESRLDFAVGRANDGTPVFTLSGETRYCYIDVIAARDGILALYAGRERRKYPGAAGVGAELHAFTWDGRFIGQWQLDEPIIRMAFDESRHALYGLRWPRREVIRIDAARIFDRRHERQGS